MSYIVGEIPYFRGFLRREYTRNLEDGHGEFYPCIVFGLRVARGRSLQLQCVLTDKYAGAMFLAPIEAYCWKPTTPFEKGRRPDMTYIQPWDCFSSEFGVHRWSMWDGMPCYALPEKRKGRYHCTLDFTGTDLADDDEQHKHLHMVLMDDGQVSAFPNNRLLVHDAAYFDVMSEKPDFIALGGRFSAE